MARPKLSTKPHSLTWSRQDGNARTFDCANEREGRQRIMYCLHDNDRMAITEANRHANQVTTDGRIYTDATGWNFLLVPTRAAGAS